MNPNGTGLLQLNPPGLKFHGADCCNAAADWSPDGSQVAFAAFWKGNVGRARRTAMFVVNADGTGLRRITPFGLGARNGATWSPDGRLIAFNLRFLDSPGSQIWVVHPDGTGLRELTLPSSGYASYEPVWSPDSSRLLFERVKRKCGRRSPLDRERRWQRPNEADGRPRRHQLRMGLRSRFVDRTGISPLRHATAAGANHIRRPPRPPTSSSVSGQGSPQTRPQMRSLASPMHRRTRPPRTRCAHSLASWCHQTEWRSFYSRVHPPPTSDRPPS